MANKLPKQFRHWCEIHGLSPVVNAVKSKHKWRTVCDSTRYYYFDIDNCGYDELTIILDDCKKNPKRHMVSYPMPQKQKQFKQLLDMLNLHDNPTVILDDDHFSSLANRLSSDNFYPETF